MKTTNRGVESQPSSNPFGLTVLVNGRKTTISLEKWADTPLRTQMRDSLLFCMADRGGNCNSASSVNTYRGHAGHVLQVLGSAVNDDQPLNAGTLDYRAVKLALFSNLPKPVPVKTVIARKLLLGAAHRAGNANLVAFLSSLKLTGASNGENSKPYSDDELRAVLSWSKSRLRRLQEGWTELHALYDLDPAASFDEFQAAALGWRAAATISDDDARRHIIRDVLLNGPPTNTRTTDPPELHWVLNRLYPLREDVHAALMLIINEFGAEEQFLKDQRIDAVHIGENEARIGSYKARARSSKGRRGNSGHPWSGGEVLRRWLRFTQPCRLFTGTDHLFLWRLEKSQFKAVPLDVRKPISGLQPERPAFEGYPGIPYGDARLRLSSRRMRKVWTARLERATGMSSKGALDPVHSSDTAWAFYKGASVDSEARSVLIGDAQDDVLALAHASQLNFADAADDLVAALMDCGVERTVAERVAARAQPDSGTTFCVDPRKTPGQAPGSLCRKTPFMCLLCPNAIHTPVHLPVLLALEESLVADRATMSAETFLSRWAGVDIALERLLNRFSPQSRQAALEDLERARHTVVALREAYG